MSDPTVAEVTPEQFPQVAERVARIDDAVRAVDGHPALGSSVWLDLEQPRADSAGFLVDDTAYAHIARGDNSTPARWMLGLAVTPGARTDGTRRALVDAAARHVGAHGGGLVALWLLGASAADDTDLAAAGLRPARDLYEMRVALPLAAAPKWPPGVHVRTFEVGRDESAWLEVNNEAFAGHAEQGGWTAQTLGRRLAEPWFDASLFFLAFAGAGQTFDGAGPAFDGAGALLGFNWLKVHDADDTNPRIGEIYVIGVAKRAQGSGLGRALAIAGLAAAYERGIETGALFVAAENEPALRLYRSLGFAVNRVDRAYECEVPAA